MRVIAQAKLVVGFGELIPMKSGADSSSENYIDTVTNYNDEPEENRKRTLC